MEQIAARVLRGLAACSAAVALTAGAGAGVAHAQGLSGGSAKTDEVDLENEQGKGVKDVTATCVQVVGFDGKLTVKCAFKNTGHRKRRFVVCMMLGLRAGKIAPVPGVAGNDYVIEQVPVPGGGEELRCRRDPAAPGPPGGPQHSFHLGCELVEVDPGKTTTIQWSEGPYRPPPGKSIAPFDFEVRYADTIDLTNEPGKRYNRASCRQVVGQGQFLVPTAPASAVWVLQNTPFEDPFVQYQPSLDVERAPPQKEYALTSDMPCAPTRLPEEIPPDPRCPEREGMAPPYFADLNLFWFGSMAQPRGTAFPATLRTRARGHRGVVRTFTDPAPRTLFEIPGRDELFGRIAMCARTPTDACVAPDVPEGRKVQVRVSVFRGRRIAFDEQGAFVADTEPPLVTGLAARRVERDVVAVTVRARDASTSPIAATVRYSTDEGRTWAARLTRATGTLLRDTRTRRFRTRIRVPGEALERLRFYVTVQDEVFNVAWFGPRRAP